MRRLLLSLLVTLIALSAPRPAPAQPQASIPLPYIEIEPDQLVAAAFSAPYGRLLIAEFTTVLSESAAANCLKTNGIERSGLEERARAITLRHGAQFMGKFAAMVDRPALKAAFAARMGTGAETELAGLRNDPNVRPFAELATARRDAAIANGVVEMLDRNILALKIKVARRFHPLATGSQKLLDADSTDDIQDKLDDLMAANKSAALARYLELTDAAQESLNQSINTNALLGVRNVDFMPGLENDMADVCVSRQ